MDEARLEVQKWQKEQQQSRKKKRHNDTNHDSDSDNGGGGGGGYDSDSDSASVSEPDWKRRKKDKQTEKDDEEREKDTSQAAKTNYRDRAKERRKGGGGMDDVTAYLKKNIVQQAAPAVEETSKKRKDLDEETIDDYQTSGGGGGGATTKKRKKKTIQLGDRILRVLKDLSANNANISKKKALQKTQQWLKGRVVYKFDVRPHPVKYNTNETPTITYLAEETSSSKTTTLTDRDKHPQLSPQLLAILNNAMKSVSLGIQEAHPSDIKKQQRREQALIDKKIKLKHKLEIKKKEIEDMMNKEKLEKLKSSSTALRIGGGGPGDDDDDDDIFADAGDYVAVVEEEEEEEEEDDDGLEITQQHHPSIPLNAMPTSSAPRITGGGSGTPPMSRGEDPGTPLMSAPVPPTTAPTASTTSTSTATTLQKGDVAYYSKENSGTDTLHIVSVHPGPPAPTESYTVIVTQSYDPMRIGRELNVLPSSHRFHVTPSSTDEALMLSLPKQFRSRVLEMGNKEEMEEKEEKEEAALDQVEQEKQRLVLEKDMIEYVLECREKQENMMVDYD
jgi:hypothetical protein